MSMQLFNRLLICTLLSIAPASIYSQAWKFEANNELETRSRLYFENENRKDRLMELKGQHDFTIRRKTAFKINLGFRSIWNTANQERTRLLLNEANVALNKGAFNFKVGKQVVKWGSLSGISNLDLANRLDYYDFIDSENEELGLWTLMGKVGNERTQLQLRFVPDASPSHIYFEASPWVRLPSSIPSPFYTDNSIPISLRDVVRDPSKQRNPILDLCLKTELADFSVALNYFSGYNDLPASRMRLDRSVLILPFRFDLHLQNLELDMYNVSVQKLVKEWNLWTEIGYIKNKRIGNEQQLIDDHYLSWSMGADRVYFFDDPAKLLKLVFQWKHTFGNGNRDYSVADIDQVLSRSWITSIDYQINYYWQVSLQSAVSYDSYGSYIQPSISWSKGKTSVVASLDMLRGGAEHFFGFYRDNSRLSFKIKSTL